MRWPCARSRSRKDGFAERAGSAATPLLSGDAMDEHERAELERLRAENERLKRTQSRGISLKVSEKGGVSVYGLGRFPVTLYKEQWAKLLDMAEEIRAFIRDHEASSRPRTEAVRGADASRWLAAGATLALMGGTLGAGLDADPRAHGHHRLPPPGAVRAGLVGSAALRRRRCRDRARPADRGAPRRCVEPRPVPVCGARGHGALHPRLRLERPPRRPVRRSAPSCWRRSS